MGERVFGWEEDTIRERVSPLPVGMATMAPGTELAVALEGIDVSVLNGYELVTVLEATMRQISHLHASFYATVHELAYSQDSGPDDPPGRRPDIDECIGDELAAALSLTRRAADMHLGTALDLGGLAQVKELLDTGTIDLPRARVLCDETRHLEPGEATAVLDQILGDAGDLTTGQLGGRLRRLCTEAKPDHARTRYKKGIEGRRLYTRHNPDGTGQLVAEGLPAERLANIGRFIEAHADNLRGKDDRTIDQIRTDVFLDLLEGNHHIGSPRRSHIDIRVDLTTLLGLDDKAGELPGWGPIISDLARQIVHRQPDGRWQLTITDPDSGEPLHTTITRRRPNARQKRHIQATNPTCVFPGCRNPATRSHIDHNHNYSQGGPTHTTNLAPLCPHHNQTKYHAGWKLQRTRPGTYQWTSPRNHTYQTRPPPG